VNDFSRILTYFLIIVILGLLVGFGIGYQYGFTDCEIKEVVKIDTVYNEVIKYVKKPIYIKSKPTIIRDTFIYDNSQIKASIVELYEKDNNLEYPKKIIKSNMFISSKFIAIDTIVNKSDTIIPSFLYPELAFKYKIMNAPDTLKTITILKEKERDKAFYEQTWFYIVSYPVVILSTIYVVK